MNFLHVLHRFETLPSFRSRDIATMARWAVVQARRGDPWAGLGVAFMAHERATKEQDTHGTMLALNASAMCHAMRNDDMTALGAAVDAFTLAGQLGDESGIDNALTTMIGSALSVFVPDRAAELVGEVVGRAMQRGDYDLEIRARAIRAIALGDQGIFYEAEAEQTEAIRVYHAHATEFFSLARLRLNVANLQKKRMLHFQSLGDSVLAEGAFQRAFSLGNEVLATAIAEQNDPVQVMIRSVLGVLLRAHGDAPAAIRMLNEALPLARQNHVQGQLPFVLVELADAYLAAGNGAEHAKTLEMALNEAVAQRPTARAATICRKLHAWAVSEGDRADAEFWQRRTELEQLEFERARAQVSTQVHALCDQLPGFYNQSRGGIRIVSNSASRDPASGA